jgi:hypothetical protein
MPFHGVFGRSDAARPTVKTPGLPAGMPVSRIDSVWPTRKGPPAPSTGVTPAPPAELEVQPAVAVRVDRKGVMRLARARRGLDRREARVVTREAPP